MTKRSFYTKVYAIVRRIPPGTVTSYGRVAAMLDNPRAARAVGYAMNALKNDNPRTADVPWQRVVGHSGHISVPGWGGQHQAELLRAEGVLVSENLRINLDRFLWDGLLPHEVRQLLESI